MKKKKRARIVYGKDAHYSPDDIDPFLLAGACIEFALEKSEKASLIFGEVIEAWGRPGCQLAVSEVDIRILNMDALVEHREDKPKINENVGEIFKRYKDDRDCQYLIGLVEEFIKVGFNRAIDQTEGKYKVLRSKAPWLCFATGWRALVEFSKERPDWEQYRMVNFQGENFDLSTLLEGQSNNRRHRRHVKLYKSHGWRLRQDQKIRDMAWYWYQCRVVYSGPEEFCRKYLLETGIELRPENIVKEIVLCDDAFGYTRKGIHSDE